MTRHLNSKIKQYNWDCPVHRHWLRDSRFSKDGIEGISTPIISRGPISLYIEVDEDLTIYQFEKLKKDSCASSLTIYNPNKPDGYFKMMYL